MADILNSSRDEQQLRDSVPTLGVLKSADEDRADLSMISQFRFFHDSLSSFSLILTFLTSFCVSVHFLGPQLCQFEAKD